MRTHLTDVRYWVPDMMRRTRDVWSWQLRAHLRRAAEVSPEHAITDVNLASQVQDPRRASPFSMLNGKRISEMARGVGLT